MSTVYISNPIHPEPLAAIRQEAEVLLGYGSSGVDYPAVAGRVDAVLTRGLRMDRAAIEASPRLRIIARHGVGFDGVDVEAATEHGVWVTTTPGSNATAVAEHVFALLLGLARRAGQADAELRSGAASADPAAGVGFELGGRRIGVIGFGAIGRRVTSIARGFGMDAAAFDPYVDHAAIRSAGAEPLPLAALLADSDIVTVHVPLAAGTRHLIGVDQVAALKPGAIVVNTARGGVVDARAVVDAIRAGRIAGAAFDVLEDEGSAAALLALGTPLPGPERLILTPHIAGQTEESLREAGTRAWASIRAVLAGERPADPVNDVASVL